MSEGKAYYTGDEAKAVLLTVRINIIAGDLAQTLLNDLSAEQADTLFLACGKYLRRYLRMTQQQQSVRAA